MDKGWRRREVIEAGLATSLAGMGSTWAAAAASASDLARVFADPPPRARPGCYWYWMGGAVTDAGITRDLEEMERAGIGAAMLFSIGGGGAHPLVDPPADALTPTWWARVRHAAAEAERVGVELAFNACDGWATAAGPWITPDLSMHQLVWTEQFVDGGALDMTVEQPAATQRFYRDIALLALPVGAGWEETSAAGHATVTTDLPIADLARLADPSNAEQVVDTVHGGFIQFAFVRPFTLRSITVRTAPVTGGYSPGVYRAANSLWVEASDDGMRFRPVGRLDYPEHGWQTDMTTLRHALPPTRARVFRLVHRPEGPFPYEEERDFGQETALRLSSLVLSSMPAVGGLPVKNGAQWGRARRMTAADLPHADCTPPGAAIDLSDRLTAGRLRATLPSGRWRLLRLGYTTNGKGNSAAGAGKGLECSRFDPVAVNRQYDGWFGRVRTELGAVGRAITTIHIDSWEAGTQNWSPTFADEFRQRRGYDLRPWLPVLAGVPVESADATERVLFDLRRTIADLVRDVFYATFASRAAADGVRFSGEPASPTFPVDGLDYARFLDMPMGEFWYRSPRNDKPNDVKDAVSGGRIYGRPVLGAEAFTQTLMDWTEQPASWKLLADHNWCEGVNRLMIHVWCGQPFPDRGPGMTLNGIGSQTNYLQSWWEPGRSWFDYLGRAQALLQQGRAVADVAYFIGEDVPTRALLPRQLRPALPPGYAYDSINCDALLRLARVEGGWIVLPGGARYRLLVLPPADRMTPELAGRLVELAGQGAKIVGPRPVASPSRSGGEAADIAVRRAAEAGWGAGRIAPAQDLRPVLRRLELLPDVEIAEVDAVEWTHRQGAGWDAYLFANQADAPAHFTARVRVSGRAPELWDAEHGRVTRLGAWTDDGARTAVPMSLPAHGSVFLVLAEPAGALRADPIADPDATVIRDGARLRLEASRAGTWRVTTPRGPRSASLRAVPAPVPVSGPWLIRFAERLPEPRILRWTDLASWSEKSDPAIRFYSGLATYTTMILVPLSPPGATMWLDLGRVESLATVRLNGREVGRGFQPPFLFDVTAHVRTGRNLLEVDVGNTWRNRLIGDFGRPEDARVSFVVPLLRKGKPWLPGGDGVSPDPAGLLGPVRLLTRLSVDIT